MHHGRFGEIDVETKKIIITGANGFIGSNLTRLFLKNGYEVHIILRRSSDLWRIEEIMSDVNAFYIVKSSKEEFSDIFRSVKPDFLINAIGADQKKNTRDETSTWIGNFDSLINITAALKNWPNTFLIQLGSSFEYGRTTLKNNPLNEESACEPVSEYGITKLLATDYLKYLWNNKILRSASLRIFNVYGQYEAPERLIPDIILKTIRDSKIVLKNPKVSRDFIHITDVVDAVKLIVAKEDHINDNKFEVLNVGSGEAHTVEEVANYIRDITGSILPTEVSPSDIRPENSFPGPIADIGKARSELGWKPRLTLEEGLKITINWFRQNIQLYEKL
jgi:nucleoside-diphosphate-sugar epimerase